MITNAAFALTSATTRASPYAMVPPANRIRAAHCRSRGTIAYVLALVVALVNAIAAFVIIALIAVYYVFENTPTSPAAAGKPPGTDSPGDDEPQT